MSMYPRSSARMNRIFGRLMLAASMLPARTRRIRSLTPVLIVPFVINFVGIQFSAWPIIVSQKPEGSCGTLIAQSRGFTGIVRVIDREQNLIFCLLGVKNNNGMIDQQNRESDDMNDQGRVCAHMLDEL